MFGSVSLILALLAPGSWHYDDEAVEEVKPAPRPAPAVSIPPRPAVTPIPIPPVRPAPKPEVVERRPTAVPEQPDANVRALIEQKKAETPKEPVQAPRRNIPVVRTCDKPVTRLAPRWRLADSTGKVWVAYDRAALVTHVRAVNAVLLEPELIVPAPVVTRPIVEMPPTTVVSTPVVVEPAPTVFSVPVTTSDYWQVDTWSSAPRITPHTIVAPSFAAPRFGGGGCSGGRCR